MNLNYDSILSDLKNARKTISTLRQERDLLRDHTLKLEENNKKLLKQLEKLNQENLKLRQILKSSELNSSKQEIKSQIEQISEDLDKFSKQMSKRIDFPLEKIVKSLENERFCYVISLINQEFLSFIRDSVQLDDNKSFSFNQNSSKELISHKKQVASFVSSDWEENDFDKLICESSALLESLDKQNVKMVSLAKNISRIADARKTHQVSKSMANLRVPEFC